MFGKKKKDPHVPPQAGTVKDATQQMVEAAEAMTLASKSRGKVDPQKLQDAAERMQKLIEQENKERDKRLQKLDEDSKKLKKASEELLKTAEKQRDELLDKNMTRAREQQQEADWRKQGCPVIKPVTVGKPIKLKKPKP